METKAGGVVLLALAGLALRLGLTDAAFAYVKPGLQPLLVLTAILLAGLGVAMVVTRRTADVDGHDHGSGAPRVAWMLVLPVLAIALVAPPPLGAFAAARQSDTAPADRFRPGPLPAAESGAVPLPVKDFVQRALYDEDRSLDGATVRLVGFVSAAGTGSYEISRFSLSCCAADALPARVQVLGDAEQRDTDVWVEITGVWSGAPAQDGAPGIEAQVVRTVTAPSLPYEY